MKSQCVLFCFVFSRQTDEAVEVFLRNQGMRVVKIRKKLIKLVYIVVESEEFPPKSLYLKQGVKNRACK